MQVYTSLIEEIIEEIIEERKGHSYHAMVWTHEKNGPR